MYRNEVTRTVYSALTKIQGANSKQARENFLRTYVLTTKIGKISYLPYDRVSSYGNFIKGNVLK